MNTPLKIPSPLDRSVAALRLACRSNNINEFFDSEVSAYFGTNRIKLPVSEGGFLSINCKIKQAMIQFHWVNCDLDAISGYDEISGQYETKTVKNLNSSSKKQGAGGKAGASLRGLLPAWITLSGNASASTKKTANTVSDVQKTIQQVNFSGSDAIIIQPNSDGSPLQGSLVKDTLFGRFKPRSVLDTCVVAAEILVTETWVEYLNPKPVNLRADLERRWDQNLAKRRNKSDKFHRDAFNILLSHLVTKGLQRDKNSDYATLAMDAILAVPEESDGDLGLSLSHLEHNRGEDRNAVSFKSLLHVVESRPKDALRFLLAEGVESERVQNLASKYRISEGGLTGSWFDLEESTIENDNLPVEYGVLSNILNSVKIVTPDNIVHTVANATKPVQDGTIVSFKVPSQNPVAIILEHHQHHALTAEGEIQDRSEIVDCALQIAETMFEKSEDGVIPFDDWEMNLHSTYFAPKPIWAALLGTNEIDVNKLSQTLGVSIYQSRDSNRFLVSKAVPSGATVPTFKIKDAVEHLLKTEQDKVLYMSLAEVVGKSLHIPSRTKKSLGVNKSWRTIFEDDDRFSTDQYGVYLKRK